MCEEPIVYFPFVANAKTCGRCLLNVAVASFWWINLGMFPNFSGVGITLTALLATWAICSKYYELYLRMKAAHE